MKHQPVSSSHWCLVEFMYCDCNYPFSSRKEYLKVYFETKFLSSVMKLAKAHQEHFYNKYCQNYETFHETSFVRHQKKISLLASFFFIVDSLIYLNFKQQRKRKYFYCASDILKLVILRYIRGLVHAPENFFHRYADRTAIVKSWKKQVYPQPFLKIFFFFCFQSDAKRYACGFRTLKSKKDAIIDGGRLVRYLSLVSDVLYSSLSSLFSKSTLR